jgi:hypothetical protein
MVKFGQWGWAGAVALVGYIWNKQDKKISSLEAAQKDTIKKHEAEKMIKDIVEPIIQDQKEVKQDLKNILSAVTDIKTELAVQAAVYKLTHDKE